MSEQIKDGGSAFPHGPLGDTMHGEDGREWHQYPAGTGMSLRDWFAGQAIAGAATEDIPATALAQYAYELADCML